MARARPAGQRRAQLLDAAEALMLRAGVESLTVDDVTAAAGVAKGTFYLHFSSKDDLVGALRDRYVERFAARQIQIAGSADGVERVERWMLAGIAEYLGDMRLHDVLFHSSARPERPGPNPAVEAIVALLADAGAAVPDPEATAVVLYHVMHGSADHVYHFPGDRERLMAEAARLCRALVTI
ncbi:TetR/AcrR family transcriptional regulator [Nonomuraea endophytica]|uniref:AcrR family transcriptional regulator n=1 Tax=Nonomuraea endophytica TaxID=714136 RepID=A0A7W8A4I5_9ACTN|nr:TetR/AcrR family transcriptional regulator [Nonomuraea endophytica]MBB5079364.1 AcrR family transcriptional regulator [Nonomuraea endophytica]